MKAADLLKEAITSSPDPELLKLIRKNAKEIHDFLETTESDRMPHFDVEGVDPLWLAEIYTALGEAEPFSDDEQATIDVILQASQLEEETYGAEFQETLMPGLPPKLKDLDEWFGTLAKVRPEKQAYLRTTPSAQAAPIYAHTLARYGLTPLSIFYATKAVSSLIWRWMRHGDLKPSKPVTLTYHQDTLCVNDDQSLGYALVAETRDLNQCDETTAQLLLRWVFTASHYKPCIFRRLEAMPIKDGIRLERVEDVKEGTCLPRIRDFKDLYERWRVTRNVGVGLKLFAKSLPREIGSRDEFRKALVEISTWNTPDEVMKMAHQHDWPSWAVTCLPEMYFVEEAQPDGTTRACIWEHVFSYIPKGAYPRKEVGHYCGGVVVEMVMPKKTASFVNYLAPRIEDVRRGHPFYSDQSLKSAVDDAVHLQIGPLARLEGRHVIAAVLEDKHRRFVHELTGSTAQPS